MAAFDWSDYVTLAAALAAQPGEAELRASTSRAYYGVYCTARNKLPRRPPWGRSSHKWVWDQYRNSADATRKRIGLEGDRLKKMRVDADYRDIVVNPGAMAAASVKRANSILQMVARLP